MVVRPITLGETSAAIIQSTTIGIVPQTIISIILRTHIVVIVCPIRGGTTVVIIQSNIRVGAVPTIVIKSPMGIINTWFVVHRALSFDRNDSGSF